MLGSLGAVMYSHGLSKLNSSGFKLFNVVGSVGDQ